MGHNERGFLFDVYGRVKEWRCPTCGEIFKVSTLDWPENANSLWRDRYYHLKKHEGESNGEV